MRRFTRQAGLEFISSPGACVHYRCEGCAVGRMGVAWRFRPPFRNLILTEWSVEEGLQVKLGGDWRHGLPRGAFSTFC